MPSVTAVYSDILAMISSGNANRPIISRTIEHALKITGSTVRDAVRFFRRRGEPIIATECGYYMATKPEEVQIVISDLTARIASMSKTVTALRNTAADRFGIQAAFNFSGSGAHMEESTGARAEEIHSESGEPKAVKSMPDVRDDRRPDGRPEGLAERPEDDALVEVLAMTLMAEMEVT